MLTAETPCKDCETRFVGCHQYCDDYQEWHKMRSAANKQKAKETEVNSALNGMKESLVRKYGKKK